ncbi:MAG: ATP-grasp domain-containing protein [Candidatus Woesearchaeota archaeon]
MQEKIRNKTNSSSDKCAIGLIYSRKFGKEEKMFQKIAKKKGMVLIPINISRQQSHEEFEHNVMKCDVIYNNSADDIVVEYIKTIEEMGKKVIDNSRLYYYTEDKWMFYLKCRRNNIPTLETTLLPLNLNAAKKQLRKFGKWPVVLKRVIGTCGEYVEKADDLDGAIKIIRKFWNKGTEKLPIIAQEFVNSQSYRVTVLDGKIVQTAKKSSTRWKATGIHAKKIERFLIDKELERIVKKTVKAVNIHICGIDLFKKNDHWVVLEVNSEPALDFFDDEQAELVGLVLDTLKKYAKKS